MNDNDFFPLKLVVGVFENEKKKYHIFKKLSLKIAYHICFYKFLISRDKMKKKTPQTFPKFLNRKFPIGI